MRGADASSIALERIVKGRISFLVVLPSLLLALFGCGGRGESPTRKVEAANKETSTAPAKVPKLSEEERAKARAQLESLRDLTDAERRQRELDRRELVRPAPRGFKPEAEGRKVELRLIPKKRMIRKGESFWYRLELQNVGSEPIHFYETDSFFKNGANLGVYRDGIGYGFNFYAVEPGSTSTIKLLVGFGGYHSYRGTAESLPDGWDRMSPQEKQSYIRQKTIQAEVRGKLNVTLQPGEALVTRPWQFVHPVDRELRRKRGLPPVPRTTGSFRELWIGYRFAETGTYRIHALYVDLPPKLSEQTQAILRRLGGAPEPKVSTFEADQDDGDRHLGVVKSNVVDLEVVQ